MATLTSGAQDLSGNGLASNFVWSFTTATQACQPPVPLASVANFDAVAGSTVTNTGPTTIAGGDLGLSPGSAITGFPPGTLISPSVMHITDPTAAQGELDLTIAYNYAATLPGGAVLPGDLSGLTFAPGLYKNSSTVMLSAGNVTLDGQGNANAVFIFQIGSTLTTLGSTQIVLAGGAQAKNIFWQVSSSATLGTNSIFKGTLRSSGDDSRNRNPWRKTTDRAEFHVWGRTAAPADGGLHRRSGRSLFRGSSERKFKWIEFQSASHSSLQLEWQRRQRWRDECFHAD
jgi:hypothetical protein